jgi:hypothetical protein
VFDALDNKPAANDADEKSPTVETGPGAIPYRNEPVAFFFVLFGLAFEALAGKTGDSGPSRTQTLEILTALKKILRPAVSGNAIYQEVIFSETMDLLDRLVLTEGLDVQAVIVEIARNLCLEHPSARKIGGHGHESGHDNLSDDIDQLFELTRLIILVITGLIPSPPAAPRPLTDEAVALASSSLTALVDCAAVFPPIIESDLHACLGHIFCSILASPAAQASLVPQTLPIIRRFYSSLVPSPDQPVSEVTTGLFRASLSRFLHILRRSQVREDAVTAPMCEKNSLMAATLLFGVCAPALSPADEILTDFGRVLCECLNSRVPGKVAAGCMKSVLVVIGRERSRADDVLAGLILPYLLWFVAGSKSGKSNGVNEDESDEDESEEDSDEDEDKALEEDLDPEVEETRVVAGRALPAIAQALPASLSFILPTLLARARSFSPSSKQNAQIAARRRKQLFTEIASRIGECAAAVGGRVFGQAIGTLSGKDRSLLEEVIREGGGVKKVEKEEGPVIELKMDFLGAAS